MFTQFYNYGGGSEGLSDEAGKRDRGPVRYRRVQTKGSSATAVKEEDILAWQKPAQGPQTSEINRLRRECTALFQRGIFSGKTICISDGIISR